MIQKIKVKIEDCFKQIEEATKVIHSIPMDDINKATQETKLQIGFKIETLRSLNVQFNTYCDIWVNDLEQKIENVSENVKTYYDLQVRARTERIPEDDEQLIKFKEYLKIK